LVNKKDYGSSSGYDKVIFSVNHQRSMRAERKINK